VGEYSNGLQEGTWIYQNEKGVRDSVQVYRNGQLVTGGE
jgi:antitoxin component YwqK of YwqJK toxin-antitoxin module